MGIILAVLMICAVVSTRETRAAGRAAVQPFARVAGIIAAVLVAAVLFLPRDPD